MVLSTKKILSITTATMATLATLSFTSQASAWGGRGHDVICSTAVFLVKEKGLRDYLVNKPHMMGHLCNIPDTYWKSLGPDVGKLGNSTHFIDLELLGLKLEEVPLDYQYIVDKYTGSPNKFKNDGSLIFSIPQEFGSAWWRADQFMRNIAGLKNEFTKAAPPAGSREEQNENLPYNKAAFAMLVQMGIMGHFVGDIAQPFHTTVDYDGYAVGHGGIHAYYEDSVVGEFDGDLEHRVLQAARGMKNPSFIKPATTVEKMKALSIISIKDKDLIIKLDPVLKKSELKKEKGMELKTPAERKPASVAFKKMDKLIVNQMARSAILLAHLWDKAYSEAGSPKLSSYKSYKYPFTPDFVAPDYYTESNTAPKKAK